MGILDLFRTRSATGTPTPGAGGAVSIRSPWATETPEQIIFGDVFGPDNPFANSKRFTRAQALAVPAIAAARNRVIETLAGRPLVDYTADARSERQPSWMTRTDSVLATSPHQRMVDTLDDLIFNGMSLWAVRRGADGSVSEAIHVPWERWKLDEYGVVYFDGKEAPADQVVLIPGPHAGILNIGKDTIEGGLALEAAWRARARNPVPSIILQEREDNGMTLAEAKPYVDAVAAARRNPDGAVMFIPYKMTATFEEHSGESFLENARNAIRIDVAAYFNATAQGVEASKAQSTLTYETAQQADAQTADRMTFWSEPIEARLSLDDVVPRGHRVRFNFQDAAKSTTGTPTED